MKINEITDPILFQYLVDLEPEYYKESIGTLEETRIYGAKLFAKITNLLRQHIDCPVISFYHYNRKKYRIELYWKATNGQWKDWIEVYKTRTDRTEGGNKDIETKFKTSKAVSEIDIVTDDDEYLPF